MYSIIGRKNKRKKKFSIEKQANILAQYTQAKLASTVIFNPLPTELEEAKISVNGSKIWTKKQTKKTAMYSLKGKDKKFHTFDHTFHFLSRD